VKIKISQIKQIWIACEHYMSRNEQSKQHQTTLYREQHIVHTGAGCGMSALAGGAWDSVSVANALSRGLGRRSTVARIANGLTRDADSSELLHVFMSK